MLRWTALSLLPPVELSGLPAQARLDSHHPPIAALSQYEFTQGQTLRVVSGIWATSGGTFNSKSTTTRLPRSIPAECGPEDCSRSKRQS